MIEPKSTSSSSIAVVVPTRDRARVLGRCLRHLAEQEGGQPDQLVVVDDGSGDGTSHIVDSVAMSFGDSLVYIQNEGAGLNSARNSGFRCASTDVVAFLDDDAVPPSSWLRALRKALPRHPDAVAIGGPIIERLDGGSRPVYWCRRCASTDAQFIPSEAEGPVTFLGGANMALRRADALAKVGEFDERLSGWGDEREWFSRAISRGQEVVNVKAAFVWHVRPVADARFVGRTRRAFRRGCEAHDFYRLMGEPVPVREQLVRVPRYWGHTFTRGCIFGAVATAGVMGLVVGGRGHLREIEARQLGRDGEQ